MRARKARHGCSYSSFRFFFSSLSSAAITAVAVIRTPLGNLFFFPPFFNSVCVCVSAIHRLHFDKLYFVFFFTKHPQRRIKGFRSRRLDPALLKWKKKKRKRATRQESGIVGCNLLCDWSCVCVCINCSLRSAKDKQRKKTLSHSNP